MRETNRLLCIAFLAAVLALAIPATAQADVGLGMIAILWPALWILLLPIIVIEAAVAKRVLGVKLGAALKLSAKANAVSTLVGIPLTWLALLVLELTTLLLSGAYDVPRTRPPRWVEDLLLPLMAPLGGRPYPADSEKWDTPAFAIWLCGIFFFVSVWLEARVVTWRSSISIADALRWSWRANAASYGLIELLLVGILVWTVAMK